MGKGFSQIMENAVYAQDEYGRPFIIVRDQKKMRIKGLEAQKVLSYNTDAHPGRQGRHQHRQDLARPPRYRIFI